MEVRSIKYAPFAGVVSERPYPPTGLSTRLWMELVPAFCVPFRSLWLTQAYVHIDTIFAQDAHSMSGDLYPHVVLFQRRRYLEDGHNRVTKVALKGGTQMLCRVFEVE